MYVSECKQRPIFFLISRLNSIMGMAVDWVGHNLYWTDEGLRAIFVADLQTASKRLSLISDDLVHPRSIVVDALNGLMYWANWPAGPPLEEDLKESGKIEVAWLDGSHRRSLISDDLIWPNGLSIDDRQERIYWCDSYLQRIESVSLTGNAQDSRKLHLSHHSHPTMLNQPYGLTFHREAIYWSEFEKGHVLSYDLETANVSVVLRENPQSFALKIFDRSRQPHQSHPCSNRPCSDLCLVVPSEKEYVCKCRDGSRPDHAHQGKCQEIANWSPPTHCRENEFQCKTNLKCIDVVYK